MKNIEKLDTVTGLPIYDSFIGIAREELANNFVPGALCSDSDGY